MTPTEPTRVVTLAGADLPCRSCGITVPGPINHAEVEHVETTTMITELGPRAYVYRDPEPMTLCSECRERHDLAVTLTERHLPHGIPLNGLRLVGPLGASKVAAALDGLAALGKPMPATDRTHAGDLASLVRRFAECGVRPTWESRFSPVRDADAVKGTAAHRPWSHLSDDERAELRRAHVLALADRVAATADDVAFTPPSIGGSTSSGLLIRAACLLCGVGAVTRPAAWVAAREGAGVAARTVWRACASIPPQGLGGRPSPERVTGWACADCSEAIVDAGAVGPTALERALINYLGLGARWTDRAMLSGLAGWGGIAADVVRRGDPEPAPNSSPWSHLGDIDALRDRLSRDLGAPAGGAR